MKKFSLSMISAFLISQLSVAAEQAFPLPTDVVNPQPIASEQQGSAAGNTSDNPLPAALQTINNNLNNATPTPNTNTTLLPQEQQILLQMAQAAQAASPQVQPQNTSIADEWAEQAKKKYKPEQRVTVRPGGNIMLPVAIGLMNTIKTSFKNVSVKSSDPNAILEADHGIIYVTVNTRNPVGLLIMESGVPSTAINITVLPTDVPVAMIEAQIPVTAEQEQEAEAYQAMIREQEIVEKANTEEKEIKRSDRHTERLKEILKTTALGSVPAGFTLSDDEMKKMLPAYLHPCVFGIFNETKQRMVGSRELIDVVLVQNDTPRLFTMKEEYCASQDAVAVAIMDKATLNPGEQTEIYIVRDKNWLKNQERFQTRPRVTTK